MKGPLALLLTLVAFTTAAFAAEPEPVNVDGELRVTLKNADYVKVQVNGESYDNIEFEKDGKLVIIKGLSLSLEHNAIVLLPSTPDLKQAELQVLPKDFKKQRKGRAVFLVATKTVAFEKAPADAPEKPTEPKPDPITPPAPDKGDL